MATKEPPPLPDVSTWEPRKDAADNLQSAFLRRCLATEERILLRSRHEREMGIDNYDSGLGVEDIVREELTQLLPSRYVTRAGVLNDSRGQTGGDYDIVLFNGAWVPEIKAGAAAGSRRVHLPIEGVYAVGEVKQTLTYTSLDAALEKLVVAHRLHRPPTSRTRIVENRELSGCPHGLTNPLYSFVVATRLDDGLPFDAVVRRFVEINQHLRRLEMVRALCVLGVGTVCWVYRNSFGELKPALFMEDDLQAVLTIGFEPSDEGGCGCAFYSLVRNLMLHLYHSVLAPEDIAAKYGASGNAIKIPETDELCHHAFARPVNSPSVPWDYVWDPFGSTKVDRSLGAHVPDEGNEEPDPDDEGNILVRLVGGKRLHVSRPTRQQRAPNIRVARRSSGSWPRASEAASSSALASAASSRPGGNLFRCAKSS
jgi:hypothetical protein